MEMKKYNIGIFLDRSGSLTKEKRVVQQAFNLMIEGLTQKYPKDKEIFVKIWGIGKEDIVIPKGTENIKISKLELEKTNLSEVEIIYAGIKKLITDLGETKIFIFSDGYFEKESVGKFENTENIEILPVAVGEGAKEEVLKSFSDKKEVFHCEDVYDLI